MLGSPHVIRHQKLLYFNSPVFKIVLPHNTIWLPVMEALQTLLELLIPPASPN